MFYNGITVFKKILAFTNPCGVMLQSDFKKDILFCLCCVGIAGLQHHSWPKECRLMLRCAV